MNNEYSKPVVITKEYNTKDLYTLLVDGTEDGKESPLVWYNSTHQWNKIPDFEVFIHSGVWSFGNTPRNIGGNLIVDVQWYTELTGLNVFPLSSVTIDKLDERVKPAFKPALSGDSYPFVPKKPKEGEDTTLAEKKRLMYIKQDIESQISKLD